LETTNAMRSFAVLGLLACLWSTPALAGKGESVDPMLADLEVPPKGKAMYATGFAFIVTGAVSLVGGTALFAVSSQTGAGFLAGIDSLVIGGGFLTLGGLLMHFGEERRFAYLDWKDDRATPKRAHTRRRGAGAILSGTLTLAGGAAAFAFGASSSVACPPPDADGGLCGEVDPVFVIPQLTIGATAMALGSALMVVGIRNRTRYLDWRVRDNRMVLQPTGGASARGAFIGLSGRF
jgi:hypothetical protein